MFWQKSILPEETESSSWYPQLQEVGGIIKDIALSAKVITIQESKGNEISLAWIDTTRFYDKNNNLVDISFFKQGMWIGAHGERTNKISMVPQWVKEWYPPGTQVPTEE